MCGTGVGTLVLPPLVELAILHLGWRGAMRALAALCLASVSCGAVMFPAPAPEPAPEETQESEGAGAGQQQEVGQGRKECRGARWLLSLVVGADLATSPALALFCCCSLGDFLATMSLYIPYTHLPDMAIARGVPPARAAFLISAAGICSTVGRVVAGLLCDQVLYCTALYCTELYCTICCVPRDTSTR